MTTPTLTDREKLALQGKLTRAAYEDLGMDLFAKGLVSLDPLAVRFEDGPNGEFRDNGIQAFPLTALGRCVALTLREEV